MVPTNDHGTAAPAGDVPRPLHGFPARGRCGDPAAGAEAAASGLSIVVPAYNEAASLQHLHARLVEIARTLRQNRGLACEVIYVDDGSGDDTLAIARGLPATALDVQVLSLSRNFGKEAALLAGLDHARLGAVLFIDGDGQHPPDMIETLVRHWLDDACDVVFTAKAHRSNEPLPRRILVKMFYLLLNWGARTKIPEDAGDFRLLSPRAADALRRLPERNRFFKGLASWIGFRQMRIDYEPAPRADGRSRWNLRTLIGLSLNGLTAFSVAPLRFATMLGLFFAVIALIYGIRIVYETLVYGERVPGYPSVFVGVMVLGGVQLIMLGVLGEYVGKVLEEIKGRPVYFVAEHDVKERDDAARGETDARTAAE
ncbi:MAG TPA: glycosyltransferase family 2 protein [Xanthobacteraceae bacterium]|jgi:glycosyltransferase involved in cell wall biosynthesis